MPVHGVRTSSVRLISIGLLCCAFAESTASAESARYVGYRDYLVAGTPEDVIVADVNHDGVPDVAVATFGGISLFLGDATGLLRGPIQVGSGWIQSAAIADFNGDTHPDIAADLNGDAIGIFFGRGDGAFGPGRVLAQYCVNCTLAAGDFNGDGHADIAAASGPPLGGQGLVTLLLNTGTGTFVQSPTVYPTNFTTSVERGDVDGDGNLDLVVTDFGANTLIVLSDFTGSAFSRADYPIGDTPFKAVVADFTGDLLPDLAVNDRDTERIYFLRNLGGGSFGPAVTFAAGCTPFAPQGCALRGLAATDFNADGRQDLATPGSVLLGNGDGTFQPPVFYPAGAVPGKVAIARFAAGGPAHLIVANIDAVNISVVPAVRSPGRQTLATGARPVFSVDGDFNLDGNRDLAVAAEDAGVVSIYLGNGDGTFVPGTSLSLETVGALVHEDFNGDGLGDLAASGVVGTTIFLGNGDGTFTTGAHYANFYGDCTLRAFEQTPASCLAYGDINGDGIGDLIGANWIAVTVLTMFGNGDGTFRPGPSFTTPSTPFHLTLADFDRDGKLDLAIPQFGDGVWVHRGIGNGTFGPGLQLLPTATPYGSAAADMNGDGNPDLVVSGGASASTISLNVYFLPGNGDGTFGAPINLVADLNPVAVAIADVNNDGHLDIVSANYEGYSLSIFAGDGAGGFSPQLLYGASQAPGHVLVADFNGDGRPDVVTSNHFSNNVIVALHVPY